METSSITSLFTLERFIEMGCGACQSTASPVKDTWSVREQSSPVGRRQHSVFLDKQRIVPTMTLPLELATAIEDARRGRPQGPALRAPLCPHAANTLLPAMWSCRREMPLKAAGQVAEPAEAVAIRIDGPILLPQDRQGHAGLLQLDRNDAPIRLW